MDLEQKLWEYHRLSQRMHEEQSYDPVNGLIVPVSEMERALLAEFGLPYIYKYSEILQAFGWTESMDTEKIVALITVLHTAADDYLLTPPKTNLTILTEGQQQLLRCGNVLPEIGLSGTPYQIYLFETILLRYQQDADDVLAEMILSEALAEEISAAFSELICHPVGSLETNLELLEELYDKGMKYMDGFPEYLVSEFADTELRDEIDCIRHLERTEYDYPETITLNISCWKTVHFMKDSRSVCIDLYSNIGGKWVLFSVFMLYEQFIELLLSCEQVNHAANFRGHCIAYFDGDEIMRSEYIYIRKHYNCYLVCKVALHCMQIPDDSGDEVLVRDAYIFKQ